MSWYFIPGGWALAIKGYGSGLTSMYGDGRGRGYGLFDGEGYGDGQVRLVGVRPMLLKGGS